MARPIEYDKEVVLSSAMEVFWRQGYDSTSMKDLVEATGLTTRSMYNIFESKNGLFKACLKWYYEINVRSCYEKLIKEDGLMAVRNFFSKISSLKSNSGCLYVNTFSDRSNIDEDCLKIVDEYFNNLETIFKSKLMYAKEFEEYNDDPELRAKQLIMIIQGFSVRVKNVKLFEENNRIIEDFLSMMNI